MEATDGAMDPAPPEALAGAMAPTPVQATAGAMDPVPPVGAVRAVRIETTRKLIHIATALLAAALVVRFQPATARAILALAAAVTLAADLGRLRFASFARLVDRAVGTLLRPRETRRLSGATTLVLGLAATTLLFPAGIAVPGILYAGVADAAGAIAGRALGRHRVRGGRSIEGTIAFFATAVVIGWAASPVGLPSATVIAAILAMLELAPLPIDDNLLLPLAGSLLTFLVSTLP